MRPFRPMLIGTERPLQNPNVLLIAAFVEAARFWGADGRPILGCFFVAPRRTVPAHLDTFPPLNSNCIRPASTATTGGFVLMALSNARRELCLPSPIRENARPIKH